MGKQKNRLTATKPQDHCARILVHAGGSPSAYPRATTASTPTYPTPPYPIPQPTSLAHPAKSTRPTLHRPTLYPQPTRPSPHRPTLERPAHQARLPPRPSPRRPTLHCPAPSPCRGWPAVGDRSPSLPRPSPPRPTRELAGPTPIQPRFPELALGRKSRRRTAYPQQIVTTRLLYCLQDRFAQLSRLQRI